MALLQYDISVTGVQAVEAAFKKVEGYIGRINRAVTARPAAMGGSGAHSDVMLNKTALTGEKAVREAEKQAAREAKAREKAAKDAAKAEQQKTRALEREVAKREKLQAQEYRNLERWASREEALQKRQERAQRAAQSRLGQKRYEGFSRIVGGAWGTVSGLGMTALATAGLGAGALFATAVHSQVSAMGAASRLANQFSENGSTLESIRATKRDLLKEAGSVQGYTSEEVLAAMASYHEKTGEAGSARRMVKGMADLALATGTDLTDISTFGSTIHNVLKTAGKSAPEAEAITNRMLNTAAAQAKEKSIEMRNFAAVGGAVMAQAPMLAGDIEQGMRTGMAITQLAIAGGATGPEEAATSYQNLISDLVKHQKTLKKMGVTGSIKGGKLDLENTLVGVMEKTGGDIDKMMKVANIRGMRSLGGLAMIFRQAEEQKKGTGGEAVRKELHRLGGLSLSQSAIDAGKASRMEDPDMQWKEAQKRFNREIGTALLPAITKLIPKIAELAPLFARMAEGLALAVDFLMRHPFESLGLLITGALLKEIAAASIGSALKGALTGMMGAAGAGPAGAIGAITITAAAVYLAGKVLIDRQFDAKSAGENDEGVNIAATGKGVDIATKRARLAKAKEMDTGELTSAEQTANFFALLSGKSREEIEAESEATIQRRRATREELEQQIQNAERGPAGNEFMGDAGKSNPLGIGSSGPASWTALSQRQRAAQAEADKTPKEDPAAAAQAQAAERQVQAANAFAQAVGDFGSKVAGMPAGGAPGPSGWGLPGFPTHP